MHLPLLTVAMLATLASCASLTTSPRVESTRGRVVLLPGGLDFDGDRGFLPDLLRALPPADTTSRTVYRYRYEVRYSELDLTVLALFNPLTLLGCPTGSVSVSADGALEVSVDGTVVKRYAAATQASRIRTVYTGDPLSRLRRDALLATATSINAQMTNSAPRDNELHSTDGGGR